MYGLTLFDIFKFVFVLACCLYGDFVCNDVFYVCCEIILPDSHKFILVMWHVSAFALGSSFPMCTCIDIM